MENENITEDRLQSAIAAMGNINKKIMSDSIVQNALNSISVLRQKLVDKNTTVLASEITQYLRGAITNLDKLIQEKPTTINMYKCIKMNALFVLNSHLFGTNDKKIFKALIDLNTKVKHV